MASTRSMHWVVAAAVLAAVTTGPSPESRDLVASTRLIGSDHIVSWAPLPDETGEICPLPESFYQRRGGGGRGGDGVGAAGPPPSAGPYTTPVRVIRDRYPSFSSIAVDLVRDQVVVTDENLFQILFYSRTENNGSNQVAKPVRAIGSRWDEALMNREEPRTKIEFQCGLYIDPRNGEVYAVNNDTQDTLVIFSSEQIGNVAPHREIHTPHGTFGITVDEAAQEVFLTVQHDSAIVAYRKGAGAEEPPLRLLQGDRTRLADPHGIAFDPKRGLLFVTNHGSVHSVTRDAADPTGSREGGADQKILNFPLDRDFAVPGSGRTLPPSITVYAKNASGDTPPVRVIQGPRTLLNWPTGIAVDAERDEVYVTNDTTNAILVFDATASGDVAPKRVLQGPRTGLKNPTGIALDFKHGEFWVANFGGHTATAYRLGAAGDTPPLRTIRAASDGTPSLMIGNPGAMAFDTRREEILVPN